MTTTKPTAKPTAAAWLIALIAFSALLALLCFSGCSTIEKALYTQKPATNTLATAHATTNALVESAPQTVVTSTTSNGQTVWTTNTTTTYRTNYAVSWQTNYVQVVTTNLSVSPATTAIVQTAGSFWPGIGTLAGLLALGAAQIYADIRNKNTHAVLADVISTVADAATEAPNVLPLPKPPTTP